MNLFKLHPIFIHFPIVLIPFLLVVAFYRRDIEKKLVNGIAIVTCFFTLASVLSGWFLLDKLNFESATLNYHKYFAISALAFLFIATVFIVLEKLQQMVKPTLTLSTLAVIMAAYMGGKSHYGDHYIFDEKVVSSHAESSFYRDVQPILNRRCLQCHNQKRHEGKLLLDSFESFLQGGEFGKIFVAGNAQSSKIIQYISSAVGDKHHMPRNSVKLSKPEVDKISHWISSVKKEDLPKITQNETPKVNNNSDWPFKVIKYKDKKQLNIDLIVEEKIKSRFLQLEPLAAPLTQLKRMKFDLTGLPLSAVEIEEAQSKKDFDSYYIKKMEEYLNSKSYGISMAYSWLNLVRFAEGNGFTDDNDIPGSFQYRDYIIKSFNQQKDWKRFISEQIAGDLTHNPSEDLIHASYYLRIGPRNNSEPQNMYNYDFWDNLLNTTMVVNLGLNMSCARCHDHKYEPIRQDEYYSLLPAVMVDKYEEKAEKYLKQLHRLNFRKAYLDQYLSQYNSPPLMKFKKKNITETPLLIRGDYNQKSDVIQFNFPAIMNKKKIQYWKLQSSKNSFWDKKYHSYSRVLLVEWLFNVENGAGFFLARNTIDHLWRHHFGIGLVETPGNHGAKSKEPFHFELLNRLAWDLINNDWNIQSIQKKILLSQVYRQKIKKDAIGIDHKYTFSSYPGKLKQSYHIWDSLLASVSSLQDKVGGIGVRLPLSQSQLNYVYNSYSFDLTKNKKLKEFNPIRAIFIHKKRRFQNEFFKSFNHPGYNSPISLEHINYDMKHLYALMNSPFVKKIMDLFINNHKKLDPQKFIRKSYLSFLERIPNNTEMEEGIKLLIRSNKKDFIKALLLSDEYITIN